MIQSTLKKATTRTSFIEKKKKKEDERNRMQQTDHSETHTHKRYVYSTTVLEHASSPGN